MSQGSECTALEVFEELTVDHTTFHRNEVGWDLLDGERVVGVICVRKPSGFVTVSLPEDSTQKPKPDAWVVKPYGEELVVHITADGAVPRGRRVQDSVVLSTQQARELLARLIEKPVSRAEGRALAEEIASAG